MVRNTRRELLRNLGMATAAISLAPVAGMASARTRSSDKLTVACIGVGAQGLRVLLDLLRLDQVQVVAVCDVNRGSGDYLEWGPGELRGKVRKVLGDPGYGANETGPMAGREVAQKIANAFYAKQSGKASYSGCAVYEDFRELLAREKDLDAVAVSTPDHWHAVIAIAAMRAGKHVYSQKPMAHSVEEARAMERVARETGRATQVSIFNSNTLASRQVHDLIGSGVIGHVRSVDIWTRRASAFWKQGLPTPTEADPVPDYLNWDMWLGPAAKRPYNRVYQPFTWRAWYDFGCGALGDMGEYGLDTIMRALDFGIPDRVESSSTEHFEGCYPVASSVHFRFPQTTTRREVALNWYDGGIKPNRPAELAGDAPLSVDGEGVIYTGETGKLLTAFMGQEARLLAPDGSVRAAVPLVAEADEPYLATRPEWGGTATSANAEHYLEWVGACRGGKPALASYAFERPIVEALLLGCISVRAQEPLEWDAANARLTRGSALATSLLQSQYRAPWSIA